jgi:hypothetical protein
VCKYQSLAANRRINLNLLPRGLAAACVCA